MSTRFYWKLDIYFVFVHYFVQKNIGNISLHMISSKHIEPNSKNKAQNFLQRIIYTEISNAHLYSAVTIFSLLYFYSVLTEYETLAMIKFPIILVS